MKKLAGTLLVMLLTLFLGTINSLSGATASGKATGQQLISKSRSKVDTTMTIFYTPVSTGAGNAAGTWQLQIIKPNGKVIVDHVNGPINMQNPTPVPLQFTIKKPLKTGIYTFVLYVRSRTNSIPVNLNTLLSNFAIQPHNKKDLVTVPTGSNGFFTGNPSSTQAGDTAQIVYTFYVPPRH